MARKLSHFAKVFAVAVTAAIVTFAIPTLAQAKCPSFTKISFLGKMTHGSVRQHVENKLGGDWDAYVKKLQRRHKTLVRILKRGKGVAIKRKGRKIKLTGKQLAKYVEFSKQRLAVVTCLAGKEGANGLNDFSTAAGTPNESRVSKSVWRGKKDMQRTFITIPKKLLAKLRKQAVRQSLKDARGKSVSDVIVEILEKEMKKKNR